MITKYTIINQFFLGLPLPLLAGASLAGEVSSKTLFLGLPLPLLGGVAGEHGGGGVNMTDDFSGENGCGGVKTRVFESIANQQFPSPGIKALSLKPKLNFWI